MGRRVQPGPQQAQADLSAVPAIGATEGELIIRADDTLAGFVRRIPVDMVVLAVGLEPQADARDVRRMVNVSCSEEAGFWSVTRNTRRSVRLPTGSSSPEPARDQKAFLTTLTFRPIRPK